MVSAFQLNCTAVKWRDDCYTAICGFFSTWLKEGVRIENITRPLVKGLKMLLKSNMIWLHQQTMIVYCKSLHCLSPGFFPSNENKRNLKFSQNHLQYGYYFRYSYEMCFLAFKLKIQNGTNNELFSMNAKFVFQRHYF